MEFKYRFSDNILSIALIVFTVLSLIPILTGCGIGGPGILDKEPAGVFMSGGMIHSKGYGASRKDDPSAIRIVTAREAAYTIALGNLLEYTQGVQISSDTSVKNGSLDDQKVHKAVSGTVKNVTILKEGVIKKIGDQVIYFVELGVRTEEAGQVITSKPVVSPGTLSADYFKPVSFDRYSTFNVIRSDVPVGITLEEAEKLLEELRQKNEDVSDLQKELDAYKEALSEPSEPTGILVNAQNSPIRQNVYAKIYYPASDGFRLLYGNVEISRPRSDILRWSDWEFTMTASVSNERVRDKPFVVNAISVGENGEPVISAEDAAKIEDIEKKFKLLEQGKVVFLTTYSENLNIPASPDLQPE